MMDTVAPVLHFLARENSPEDVLLDICLQKRGGGEALKRFTKRYRKRRVVVRSPSILDYEEVQKHVPAIISENPLPRPALCGWTLSSGRPRHDQAQIENFDPLS